MARRSARKRSSTRRFHRWSLPNRSGCGRWPAATIRRTDCVEIRRSLANSLRSRYEAPDRLAPAPSFRDIPDHLWKVAARPNGTVYQQHPRLSRTTRSVDPAWSAIFSGEPLASSHGRPVPEWASREQVVECIMSGLPAIRPGPDPRERESPMSKILFCPESVGLEGEETAKFAWIATSFAESPVSRGRLVNVISVYEYLDQGGLARVHYGEGFADDPHGRADGQPRRRVTTSPRSTLAYLPLMCAVDEIGKYVVPGEGPAIVGALAASHHRVPLLRTREDAPFNHLAQAAIDWNEGGWGSGRLSKTVLILDLDADCGSGTAEIIRSVPGIRQIDVAVDASGAYESNETTMLRVVERASEYLDAITELLDRIPKDSVSLCLFSAGVACHERGRIPLAGVTSEMLAERDKKIFRWAFRRRIPLAYVVGDGGVAADMPREDLISLHRQTVEIGAKTSNLKR